MGKGDVDSTQTLASESGQELKNLCHSLARRDSVQAHHLGLARPVLEVVPVGSGEFGIELLLREETTTPHAEAAGDEGEHVASDGNVRTVRPGVVDRSDVHTHVNIRDEESP